MTQTNIRRRLLLLSAIGLAAIVGHALQIALFSHSFPFADQWDSEAYLLFKPWMEGSLNLEMLFSPHNEHRIVWKRLFDLVLFELNGRHWDNRVIALANCLVYAAAMIALGRNVLAIEERRTRHLLFALCLLLPFTTFAYENTLWGFQSPFSMLLLFGLLCLQRAASDRFSLGNGLAVLGLCMIALFTLASGFLLAPVAAALLLSAHSEPGKQRWQQYVTIAAVLGVAIVGYAIMPKLEHHLALRSNSLADFGAAAALLLSWPAPRVPLLWLPFLFWALFSLVYREPAARADRFFCGLAVWTGIQAAALSFGRGHDMSTVPSRYVDLLLFGLVANTYFFGRLLWHERIEFRVRLPLRITLIVCAVTVAGFGALEMGRSAVTSRYKFVLWQANHELAAAMLAGVDVDEGNFALAYPDKAKLTGFLGDAAIREMLHIKDGKLAPDCTVPSEALLSRLACGLTGMQTQLPTFSVDRSPAVEPGTLLCSLDMMGGVSRDDSVAATPSTPLRFAGWIGPGVAGIDGVQQPLLLRLVSAQNTLVAETSLRIPRPDVVKALNDPRMKWGGFDMTLASRGLLPGSYRIELVQEGRACDTHQALYVR